MEAQLDDILTVLSSSRRRMVCRSLASVEETTLDWLAESVAAVENNKDVASVTGKERKRVYVSLYQLHLPKLDDYNVVDFSKQRKTVRQGPLFSTVHRCLLAVEDEMIESTSEDSRSLFDTIIAPGRRRLS